MSGKCIIIKHDTFLLWLTNISALWLKQGNVWNFVDVGLNAIQWLLTRGWYCYLIVNFLLGSSGDSAPIKTKDREVKSEAGIYK